MKKRLMYFGLSLISFMICFIIVAVFNNQPVIRGFAGDIIVMLLIYFFLKGLHDFNSLKLGIFTLLVAFGTEIIQYLQITTAFGFGDKPVVRLVFGSVFDPMDLVAYTIGAIIACFADKKISKTIS